MISLQDQSTSVTVDVGEKVTIRIEESSIDGLLWSYPMIDGEGLTLDTTRSLGSNRNEYREFVFTTHQSGRNIVTSCLRQAGVEKGIKQFYMVVNVRNPGES